jgi:hypothetical protein
VLANLKTAIAARRLTQVDLALDLKIAPTVLSEIIHGRRQADPSLRGRLAEDPTGQRRLAVRAHDSYSAEVGCGDAGDRLIPHEQRE